MIAFNADTADIAVKTEAKMRKINLAVVGATIVGAGLFLALWNTKPNGYENTQGKYLNTEERK